MFNKIYLLIFAFAPSIIGYLYNMVYQIMASIPIFNYVFIYGFPILFLLFWFWVGGKFAQSNLKIIPSVLFGNFIGIVSLILYIWQFNLIPDNSMNLFLASNSQMFSSTISIFTAKLAVLFEPVKNIYGSITLNAMQIIGLILMMMIFTAGYYYRKNKTKSVNSN